MVELDYRTREEILALRAGRVRERPDLLDGPYAPSDLVFGAIESGKPWWGITGIYFHSSGPRSIEGPSEETRFLGNPFLLVGLCEAHTWRNPTPPARPAPFHPEARRLTWFIGGHPVARATYDVGRFFEGIKAHHYGQMRTGDLALIAYNARDLGLPFLYVESALSSNITWHGPRDRAVAIRQFIHRGGSCGFPGGCNNMSPYQRELTFRVEQLPARVHVKLWREAPRAVTEAASLAFILELL